VDLVVALDAGTTSIRTVAFNTRAEPVDSAQNEFPQYFPAPGEVEHDPADFVRLAIATLREVAGRAHDRGDRVRAIGLTNQRETTVAFDRANGAARHRALVWQDRRTTPFCQELANAGHYAFIRARTGLVLDPYFSGTKMRWLLERGVLDTATEPALATVDAYLLWTLTGGPNGGVFATEPSNASRTMLFDIRERSWSHELSALLGVPLSLLPPVRPSAGTFGAISRAVVPELADVPVTAMLGDQQSALFGQACFDPGMIKATYGTGSFILATTGSEVPVVPDGLLGTVAWSLGDHGPTTYALEGSAFVAGAAVQWLRDELGLIAHAHDLEALASSVPTSDGVAFVPAFTGLGSPYWRPDARGALVGLTRGSSKAHVARAVLESLAFQVRAMTDTLRAANVDLVELRADGGAAAMDLLLALQATNSRLTVRRSSSVEATARGAATLAGLAAGVWESLDDLRDLWSSAQTFAPNEPSEVDAHFAAWSRAIERA
jgi:glycerol kinase